MTKTDYYALLRMLKQELYAEDRETWPSEFIENLSIIIR